MPPSFIQLLGTCKLWSFNKSSRVAGIINIWFKQKHTWISCAENQQGCDNCWMEVWKIEPPFPDWVSGSCKCGKVIDRTKLLFSCLSQWFDLSDGTCSLVASTIVFVTMGSIDFCISRFGMDFCNCADAIKHNFYINWATAAGLSWQYSGLHLSPTASTLHLPSVSPIGALSANYYMYLISLDLLTILAFSLPSTLLPVDPLPLLGSTTLVYHCLAYVPPSIGFYRPSISSYNNCGDNQSFPHMTSYFGPIGSHNLPVLRLVSSSPPSSFDLNCSFLIR